MLSLIGLQLQHLKHHGRTRIVSMCRNWTRAWQNPYLFHNIWRRFLHDYPLDPGGARFTWLLAFASDWSAPALWGWDLQWGQHVFHNFHGGFDLSVKRDRVILLHVRFDLSVKRDSVILLHRLLGSCYRNCLYCYHLLR